MDWFDPQALLQWLIGFTAEHHSWTGPIIFTAAMVESVAVVGALVPGAALLMVVGALIAFDALSFWPAIAWAVAGAIAGDAFSYWLGAHYRERLRAMWPFNRFPATMQRGEQFFHAHGGKSVFLGRFFGPVRAIVPAIAGMLGMNPLRFAVVNVVSALAWAPAYILPGMLFGASLELASEVALRLVVMLLILLALVVSVGWTIRRSVLLLQPRAQRMLNAVGRWSSRHPLLGPLASALVDPRQPESRALVTLAALLLTTGLLFFALLWNKTGHPAPARWDALVLDLMQSLRTPWSDTIMVTLTQFGHPLVYGALGWVVLLWLMGHQRWSAAAHWLAAVAFGLLWTQMLQWLVDVPRPLGNDPASAFPSTHTAMSTVTYGFLAVLLARELPPARRAWVYLAAGLIMVVVALSRLYLGTQWLSGVLGGLLLGIAWVALLGIAYRRHASPPLRHHSLMYWSVATLCLAMMIQVSWQLEHERTRHQPQWRTVEIAAPHWWQSAWQELPTYRGDLRADRRHPLNVQLAGPLEPLRARLLAAGWSAAPSVGAGSALLWLSPRVPVADLPLLPQVHDGRHDVLVLRRPGRAPGHQWVMRLWRAQYDLSDGRPVWIGAAAEQQIQTTLGLLRYPHTGTDFERPLRALMKDLQAMDHRLVRRTLEDPPQVQWNAEVLLMRTPAARSQEISSPSNNE